MDAALMDGQNLELGGVTAVGKNTFGLQDYQDMQANKTKDQLQSMSLSVVKYFKYSAEQKYRHPHYITIIEIGLL